MKEEIEFRSGDNTLRGWFEAPEEETARSR